MIYACLIILNLVLYFKNDLISKIFCIYDKPDNLRKFQNPNSSLRGLFLFINLFLIFIYLLFSNQLSSPMFINTDELLLNSFLFLAFLACCLGW